MPHTRFTIAGQTYPELSPYDKLILDKHIRYVGDPVALVAGVTEEAVDKALRIIRVEYDVLEPLLDFTKAKDNPIVVHPEEDWNPVVDVGGDNKRNLVAQAEENWGDVEGTLASSDIVIDRTYHTKQVQQSMMETFRAYSYKDMFGRLTIVSSTQVPFHVRRIVATALEIPKSQVRVIKAAHRRRLRREADRRHGSVSGCHYPYYGQAGHDDLHPRRIDDRIVAAP